MCIVIPAYNEELNLEGAVKGALWAVRSSAADYELIIVDDGSSDKTGQVAKKLSSKNPNIKVIRHRQNLGFGQTVRDGFKAATKDYTVGFPGDNDTSAKSLKELVEKAGSADVIISYNANPGSRTFLRRLFSKSFTLLMNLLFRLNLKYYNGSFICKSELLKKLPLKSQGMAVYAEAKVRLLKKGYSYLEIPFTHTGRKHGKSTAVSGNSIRQTLLTIYYLLTD